MAVRDLGYRPYEGERLPPSHNTWVFLRHGLDRAWGSWLIKIAMFGAVMMLLLTIAIFALGTLVFSADWPPATFTRSLFSWQIWLFITVITVAAGAGVISRDLSLKTFQFYFAKPVTQTQYLAGRMGAVAILCFAVTFIPTAICVVAFTSTVGEDDRLATMGLLLPTLIQSLLISIVGGVTSIGISSLSESRALTMSAWLLVFIVPHGLGGIVEAIAEWPWIKLASIPALFGIVADALFRMPEQSEIHWGIAAAILAAVTVGSAYLAWYRIRRAEVFT